MDSNWEKYVEDECKRQWNECQKETYGDWDSQSEETKKEYYMDMERHLRSRE